MKVVLVTGGSRGIGAATCRLAARAGWAVAVNYTVSAEGAEKVATQIQDAGGKALAFQADVADAGQVQAMFDQVRQKLGPVTGLVNNARITHAKTLIRHLARESLLFSRFFRS